MLNNKTIDREVFFQWDLSNLFTCTFRQHTIIVCWLETCFGRTFVSINMTENYMKRYFNEIAFCSMPPVPFTGVQDMLSYTCQTCDHQNTSEGFSESSLDYVPN